MPYENLGIIKVPERIARFSACIAVCIYTLYVQGWAKNRLLYSTGFIYIQVRGRCHNYRWGGWGVTCKGSEKDRTAEYDSVDEDTEQNTAK